MNRAAVYHRIDSEYCYSIGKDRLRIKIRLSRDDVSSVHLQFADKFIMLRGTTGLTRKEMRLEGSTEYHDYYLLDVDFTGLSLGYFFEFTTRSNSIFYGNDRFFHKVEVNTEVAYLPDFYTMPVIAPEDQFEVPSWTQGQVIYQIFPDRFHREDPPEFLNFVEDWHATPGYTDLHGGTLKGINSKLDYLSELGVDSIYLNPIFFADGNHKYLTRDFYRIDPGFGTLEDFKQLVFAIHKRGMKVILDGVFSSTGTKFWAFEDLMENGEKSQYKDWYQVDSFPIRTKEPVNYRCFAHFPGLPKLNYQSTALQDYIISVMIFWIKEYGIDGWRLDVSDEIPHAFWRRARLAVKNANPDTVLIGEVWYDSLPWLSGNEFDTVMNYSFYISVEELLVSKKLDAKSFTQRINEYYLKYPWTTQNSLWNLIGSHDTSRFLTLCENDPTRMKFALVLQMTLPGSPVVYYGDEVGMEGGRDPLNRSGMLWGERQDTDMLEHYKTMIALRHDLKPLQFGSLKFIENDNFIVFNREWKDQKILVVLNPNDEEQIFELEQPTTELITKELFQKTIHLRRMGFMVFQLNSID